MNELSEKNANQLSQKFMVSCQLGNKFAKETISLFLWRNGEIFFNFDYLSAVCVWLQLSTMMPIEFWPNRNQTADR